ncbi:hypothetical protein [Nocardia wallacei]|uniref:hypothetical protein n=1 Tax=Nocardia wallacei TaxID=480035 RepID=UPI0024585467|nr:hypothetical protein [Nocardia wallacei]
MLTPQRLCSASLVVLALGLLLYLPGIVTADVFLSAIVIGLALGGLGTEWSLLIWVVVPFLQWLRTRRHTVRREQLGPYFVPISESPSAPARKARPAADANPLASAAGHPPAPAHAGGTLARRGAPLQHTPRRITPSEDRVGERNPALAPRHRRSPR